MRGRRSTSSRLRIAWLMRPGPLQSRRQAEETQGPRSRLAELITAAVRHARSRGRRSRGRRGSSQGVSPRARVALPRQALDALSLAFRCPRARRRRLADRTTVQSQRATRAPGATTRLQSTRLMVPHHCTQCKAHKLSRPHRPPQSPRTAPRGPQTSHPIRRAADTSRRGRDRSRAAAAARR